MTTPRSINDYGGVFVDNKAVADPTSEISADYDNRLHCDVEQMTATTDKCVVVFSTSATAAPLTIVATRARSHMGTGSAAWPTIAKTGTGTYEITYPASFTDSLGETETITFSYSSVRIKSTGTPGVAYCTELNNVIYVVIYNLSSAASDLGGSAVIEVDAR